MGRDLASRRGDEGSSVAPALGLGVMLIILAITFGLWIARVFPPQEGRDASPGVRPTQTGISVPAEVAKPAGR